MPVLVSMRLYAVPLKPVIVLMVRIMSVGMRMRQRLVNVLVLVMLGDMQPHTDTHAECGQPNRTLSRLPVEQHRGHSTNEGSRCKVRTRPRGPQLSQCDDE